MIKRCGGDLIRVEVPWGQTIEPDQVAKILKARKVKLVAIVHGETSTGVLQPLEGISRLAHESGALLLVDAVTSLAGCPVDVDGWKIDACYSGSQKCLSCPPCLSPLSFSEAAVKALHSRKTRVQSWYLDLSLIEKYWGQERAYHHTAPISMNYALREALRLVQEEGLEARFSRHRLNHEALVAGLQAMGLSLFVPEEYRLWSLTTVRVPEGVSDARVRSRLLTEFGIEIGGGLGDLKGQIWRIGLMGYSSSRKNVLLFLSALEHLLREEGYPFSAGASIEEAGDVYQTA